MLRRHGTRRKRSEVFAMASPEPGRGFPTVMSLTASASGFAEEKNFKGKTDLD